MLNSPLNRCASTIVAFRALLFVGCLSLLAAAALADNKPRSKPDADAADKKPATGQAATGQTADGPGKLPEFKWQKGPGVGKLGELADVKIPTDFLFLDGPDTIRFLDALHNPTNGSELGTLMPTTGNWFLIFEFSDIGYVKDDEGAKLDADAILKSIREGTERSNEERLRRGWGAMEVLGWQQTPHYNPQTHNLEWGIRGASGGHASINYNIRVLGRGGVMAATLVADPEQMAPALAEAKNLLSGFTFTNGNQYSEFRPGDHVAEVGLTALVAGGGLAVAAKTGLLAKLGLIIAKGWKLLVLGVVAVGAGIKKLFSGRQSTT